MTDSAQLWRRFAQNIYSDFLHWIKQQMVNVLADFENTHWNYNLYLIQQNLIHYEWMMNEFYLPVSVLAWSMHVQNPLIAAEQAYNVDDQAAQLEIQLPQLNAEQCNAFNMIVQSVDGNLEQAHYFVQGPADTEKTFLWTALCHHYCAQNKIVLCVASLRIASLLLPEGITAHFRFQILLNCTLINTCRITQQFNLAVLI